MMKNPFRAAALVLAPAALFAASVTPPTPEEVYSAIRAGQVEKLQSWIASGWQVNAADARGNTPLIHASAVGNAVTVRVLLGAGADPKAANNLGATALVYGAADAVKAKLLVDAGANVNAAAGTGRTPLLVAASVPGNSATVRLLLEHGADWKAADRMGANPLLASAKAGNLEAVRMLVERGADVNYNPVPGGSALHFAVGNRDVATVRYLLAHDAKPNLLLNFAVPMRHGKIGLDRISPLMWAASYGPIESVKALLEAGADVNAKDVRGMTPLMFAVSSEMQDPAIVKLLLARGARREERSEAGETALDWARKFNRRPVIALLGGAAVVPVAAVTAKQEAPNTAESVERAVKLLQHSGAEFFRQAGCVACHHPVASAFAAKAARTHGVAIDEAASDEFRKIAATQAQGVAPVVLQLIDPPGATDTVMYLLMGIEAAGIEPNPATDALATYLFRNYRQSSGWFQGGIARAPMEEGRLHRIAIAVKVLNRYLPPALQDEYKGMVDQLKAQIRREPVVTTDDAAMKVLALIEVGAPEAERKLAARALEARQRADGGWGGNPDMASDAYSTGLAIYALAESGRTAEQPAAYGRGAAWLQRTQLADGSWHVKSRAPKFQPYFESGFPHGGDQWISSMGTAWAAAGLAASMQ